MGPRNRPGCICRAVTLSYPPAATWLTGRKAGLVDAEAGFLCEGVAAVDGAVADRGALFVLAEEGGLVDAGPEGFALDGEGFDGVEVGAQLEVP